MAIDQSRLDKFKRQAPKISTWAQFLKILETFDVADRGAVQAETALLLTITDPNA
jgi:hypothetical protein